MQVPVSINTAQSTTVTSVGDCGPENAFYGISIPSGYTAGNITFQSSPDNVAAYQPLMDDGGNVVTLTSPAAGDTIMFRPTTLDFLHRVRFLKLVCANAQGNGTTFQLLVRAMY